ncbi:hypothetical protein [Rhizobium sp. R635]|uniref:hypothetical protein n=1 Tax=Rhizobium sp. R635 TaxID=1764275 RepID=UPI00167EE427|nr:hypothetical protein [Rhizobium sp. R635]
MIALDDQPGKGDKLMQRRTHGGIGFEAERRGNRLIEMRRFDVRILAPQSLLQSGDIRRRKPDGWVQHMTIQCPWPKSADYASTLMNMVVEKLHTPFNPAAGSDGLPGWDINLRTLSAQDMDRLGRQIADSNCPSPHELG